MIKLSAHQVNFFPFYPIIDKIKECDIFVAMGWCDFEKNNYQNRFNIGENWYTMSVNHGMEPIVDKQYLKPEKDWNKIKVKLPEYKKHLELFDHFITGNLFTTNLQIIQRILKLLNITTRVVMDYSTILLSTARLVDLCLHYGATTYLSGPSGKHYLDLPQFQKYGINVEFQDQTNLPKVPIIQYLKEKVIL